ncbi:MAG: type II toxin-antitoxin system RelE/ParE family toxin [Candidatus Thermoplasmatota archaeon]
MTAWAVAWSRRAEKDMLALDTSVARRVFNKVTEAAHDPPAAYVRLQGADEWKLRIGDHRVLAYLSFEERRVTVARVMHRSVAYKR